MQTFASITAARQAILLFQVKAMAAQPDDVQQDLLGLMAAPSPVDQIVRTGEYLWARRTDVTNAARELAAGLVAFATVNAWHGLLDDTRGDRIVQALRRDLGEAPPAGSAFISSDQDPEPLTQFVKAQPHVPAPDA